MHRSEAAFSFYGPPVPTSLLGLVEQWNPDDVSSWLRGLDDCVLPYIHFFENKEIDGETLLMLTHGDLQEMGISCLGDRDNILQAIELLSSVCYTLETENLQSLGLNLNVKSKNLLNDLRFAEKNDSNHSRTKEDIFNVLGIVCMAVSLLVDDAKKIISWLDRSPFDKLNRYMVIRAKIWSLSVKMTTATQKLSDVERSSGIQILKVLAQQMVSVGDDIVRCIQDPLILCTAFLDRAVLRRSTPNEELGLNIFSSFRGVHVISQIRHNSPADICGKVDAGDEILQLNGQTVVGWDLRKFVAVLGEHRDDEIVFLLKKRPKDPALGLFKSNPKSNPGTPRLRQRKQHNDTLPETPTTTSPTVLTPKPTFRKARLRSNSYTVVADARPKKPLLRVEDESEGGETGGSDIPTIQLVDMDAVEDTESRIQRRASVSGGSPTMKRLSVHLSRKTSLCPRAPSTWIDFHHRKWDIPPQTSLLGVPSSTGVESLSSRNYRLSRLPNNIRPMSYINAQLKMPNHGRHSHSSISSVDVISTDDDDEDVFPTPRRPNDENEESDVSYTVVERVGSAELSSLQEGLPPERDTGEWESSLVRCLTSSSEGSVESVVVASSGEVEEVLGGEGSIMMDSVDSPEWNKDECSSHFLHSTSSEEEDKAPSPTHSHSPFPSSPAVTENRLHHQDSVSSFASLTSESQRKIEKFFGGSPSKCGVIVERPGGGWATTLPRINPSDKRDRGILQRQRTSPQRMRDQVATPESGTPQLQRMAKIGTDYTKPPKGPTVLVPPSATGGASGGDSGVGGSGISKQAYLHQLALRPGNDFVSPTIAGPVYRARIQKEANGQKWQKRWMVLHESFLSVYKTQSSQSAEFVVYVPAFVISSGSNTKSKKHIFKMENQNIKLHFSCDSENCMTQWVKGLECGTLGSEGKRRWMEGEAWPSVYWIPPSSSSSTKSPFFSLRFSDSLRRSFKNQDRPSLSRQSSGGSVSSSQSRDSRKEVKDPLRMRRSSSFSKEKF